jgi:hypothetical protein
VEPPEVKNGGWNRPRRFVKLWVVRRDDRGEDRRKHDDRENTEHHRVEH